MKRLLIANRGEIANRIIRTASRMGIETVAVFSDPDATQAFAAGADQAVALGGSTPGESYLDIDKILRAAAMSGADAVHPGYGFLSERADFARSVIDAGLIFVGPRPEAIASMGSKLEAKRIMGEAGVPLLPSAELGESLTDSELIDAGTTIGYPLLIKASAGGGGRGMRIVTASDGLVEAVQSARREAVSAFADGTVYAERYVSPSRHVEVQIFGDDFGAMVHLGERECSIQRRHQKIIEEAPCSNIDDATRQALHDAAITAGRAISYTNAGTVEFLVGGDGDFYFLEVNTRLQVEHPVTEMVTGVDLVEWQLRIAAGEPLPTEGWSAAPFGHAIEARLYAEDPTREFQPSTGVVHRFEIPGAQERDPGVVRVDDGVRVDSIFDTGLSAGRLSPRAGGVRSDGIAPSGSVSRFYDPMIAKVIAWDTSRTGAANKLASALVRATIDGIETNRSLLVRTLRHPDFLDGSANSEFLTKYPADVLGASLLDEGQLARYAVAAALFLAEGRRGSDAFTPGVRSGFRNVVSGSQATSLTADDRAFAIQYRCDHDGRYLVNVNADDLGAVTAAVCLDRASSASSNGAHCDGEILVTIGGLRWLHRVRVGEASVGVEGPFGGVTFDRPPRFAEPDSLVPAGSLVAAMPGTVVSVLADVGDRIEQGDALLVMEAMKMELIIRAPHAGVIEAVSVTAGQAVEVDQVLAVVEPDAGVLDDGQ